MPGYSPVKQTRCSGKRRVARTMLPALRIWVRGQARIGAMGILPWSWNPRPGAGGGGFLISSFSSSFDQERPWRCSPAGALPFRRTERPATYEFIIRIPQAHDDFLIALGPALESLPLAAGRRTVFDRNGFGIRSACRGLDFLVPHTLSGSTARSIGFRKTEETQRN